VDTKKKSTVRIERTEGVAILWLDKPPVNAIDLELVLETEEALSRLQNEDSTRALVITGTGPCFSAGLDLKVLPHYSPGKQRKMVEALNRTVARLYAFPMPTVAAVNGHAIAGGFILAISCDYRIGTRSSCQIGLTETRVGIPFPFSTMEALKAELSPPVARRITMVGRNMGPEDALRYGVLDELEPAEQVLPRAREVALELGSLPREGYTEIKRQLRAEPLARMKDSLRTGSDPLLDSWITEEAKGASSDLLERDLK
jgi:enoyl-CoA hydratase